MCLLAPPLDVLGPDLFRPESRVLAADAEGLVHSCRAASSAPQPKPPSLGSAPCLPLDTGKLLPRSLRPRQPASRRQPAVKSADPGQPPKSSAAAFNAPDLRGFRPPSAGLCAAVAVWRTMPPSQAPLYPTGRWSVVSAPSPGAAQPPSSRNRPSTQARTNGSNDRKRQQLRQPHLPVSRHPCEGTSADAAGNRVTQPLQTVFQAIWPNDEPRRGIAGAGGCGTGSPGWGTVQRNSRAPQNVPCHPVRSFRH